MRGELDGATAPELATELARVHALNRPVVIDLTELDFVDSGGLHAMMRPPGTNGKFSLVCPDGNVSRVLAIVRVDQVMPVYERLEDAIAALS